MAYTLGQYIKFKNIDNERFITEEGLNGIVGRKILKTDASGIEFENECITLPNNETFRDTQNYYFHCKIKRMTKNPLQFDVKLIKYNDDPTSKNYKEQFIKTIIVGAGQDTWESPDTRPELEKMWVDFEFIFTPLISNTFDTIVFELQRIREDYVEMIRYPKIIYEELGIINNVIGSNLENNPPQAKKLIRIGVQGHPGLMMCINGEEIRICKSGIYELKNGVIKVSFFSVVSAAITPQEVKDDMTNIDTEVNRAMHAANKQTEMKNINSVCCFNYTKEHQIGSFVLDYLYDDEDK